MRAEVSHSCLLFAFGFGSRSEPEFVASTVRPARMVPQLIGLFTDHLFILVHVLLSKQWRSPRRSKWLPPAFVRVTIGEHSLTERVKLPSTACRGRQVLRLRREANVGRTYNAGLRHRGLQFVAAKPSAGFRHVGNVLKD
jgi:hypothetical protein